MLLHKLRKELAVLQLKGQQHDFRGQSPGQIILLHEAGYGFLPIFRLWEDLVILIQQVAAAEVKHGKASLGLCFAVTYHIRIRQTSGSDQLLLSQRFHGIQPVP